jgi:succinate-semialdehyde dehydrogenase/glutarate-semialdehyde dehydrogenase
MPPTLTALRATPGPQRSVVVDEQAALASAPTGLLIDGAFVDAVSGRTLAVEDPATGTPIAHVADADPADCISALDAAVAAQGSWARTAPRERARILRRTADRVRDEVDTLAMILTLEMGKPLAESRGEVEFAAEYIEWFADEAPRIAGRIQGAPDGASTHMVVKSPVGPCLVITPWNFPIAVPARGIAPALAAGCTVVLRPSSLTPLSALALARIFVESGVPAGVLNVVVSSIDEATDPLVIDPRLRKLTFTGSEPVGRHLIALGAEQVVRVSVELGGCAPAIVCADADLDVAVDGVLAAKMRNGGEACTAANRIYVHRSIAEEFTRRLAARMAAIRIGRGTRARIGLGPMISARHQERLGDLVADATARGARVACAGGIVPGDGHFFAPVVLSGVPDDARVMREEIFGPIAPIAVFDDEDEAVAHANDCSHGLAAYLFTTDLERAMRMGASLEAGMIGINRGRVSCASAPFGGVKHSGYGHSGGAEGLDEYLVTRYITMPAPIAHVATARPELEPTTTLGA